MRNEFVDIVAPAIACLALILSGLVAFPETAFGSTQSGLSPGQVLGVGQQLQDGPFTLIMQGDGNLVEYESEPNGQSYPLWATGTAGDPGAVAVMQSDGNLVVYLSSQPLWNSGTYAHPGAAFIVWTDGSLFIAGASGLIWGVGPGLFSGNFPHPLPSGTTELSAGTGLFDGQTITAGNYLLAMQTDGNLVVYTQTGRPLWNTGTWGQPGDSLTMQSDGNLVIYNVHGRPIWWSGTYGYPGAFALMQSDANFVVYSSSNQPLWASNSELTRYPSGASGYDISVFQCGNYPPQPHQIGIVQVDGSSSGSDNPCLTQEAAWADDGLNLYTFLTYTTSPQQEPTCGGDQACNAGFAAGVHAFGDAQAAGVNTNVGWWLDVENAGNWSGNLGENASFVQGAINALRAEGVGNVGVYASPNQWNGIVGNYQPLVPYWMADWTGSGPQSCADYARFAAADRLPSGPLEIVQYASNEYDQDYAC
jgi:hypothetical protein